jgi:hypothetical protein
VIFIDTTAPMYLVGSDEPWRRDAIQPAIDVLRGIVDEVLPITEREALAAKDRVLAYEALSARDAIHLAVMESHGIHRIVSADKGFDRIPGIERLS